MDELHKQLADLFKVLGVESRIKIIELLKEKGPLGVNELAEQLGISPSAVSQHLKILKMVKLVSDERKGYFIPYDVNPMALEKCGRMIVQVCECHIPDASVTHAMHQPRKHYDTEDLEKYREKLRKELENVDSKLDELKKDK
jgi:DNA-binding transcriptional ArsR family regulator